MGISLFAGFLHIKLKSIDLEQDMNILRCSTASQAPNFCGEIKMDPFRQINHDLWNFLPDLTLKAINITTRPKDEKFSPWYGCNVKHTPCHFCFLWFDQHDSFHSGVSLYVDIWSRFMSSNPTTNNYNSMANLEIEMLWHQINLFPNIFSDAKSIGTIQRTH